MAQIFHPSTKMLSRTSIVAGVILLGVFTLIAVALYRSAYFTNVREARQQNVPFSHQHHVSGLGLDCRYCHTAVEQSANAGMPATQICMTCHSQIWTNAAIL